MSRIYNQTQLAFRRVDQNLVRFERSEDISDEIQDKISTGLQNVQTKIQEYTQHTNAELNVQQKRQMLDNIGTMKTRLSEYQARLHRAQTAIKQKQQAEQNRQELFKINEGIRSRQQHDTAISIGDVGGEAAFWNRSEAAVDGFLNQGISALENLREQKTMLKNARKNMLNVGGILGLSKTVIRNIDRRTTQDKFILFGGMIVVVFFIYLIIHYFS